MNFEFTLFPKVREFRAKQALGMLIAYSLLAGCSLVLC